jgi:hypothetical protein
MTSQAQIAANRANAKRSTGPQDRCGQNEIEPQRVPARVVRAVTARSCDGDGN